MFFSRRACALRPRPFARSALSGFVIALLVTPRAPVFASSHEDEQQHVGLPATPVETFAGEITYEFDSVLNKTTATYVAPLQNRGLVRQILFGAPTVHTITVAYQFAGRIASRVPDTIRVELDSDDYIDPASTNPFVFVPQPIMSIGIDGRAVQHSLSISQRIELETASPAHNYRVVTPNGYPQPIQLPRIERAHVKRKATSWFSSCEFLSMLDEHEIRGTVAGQNFTLDREVVTGLKLLAAGMLPDSEPRRSIDCR